MTLEKIEKRIETLLASDKRWPVIVDFCNKKDLNEFLYHFQVGNNDFISAGSFCGNDGTFKLEELSDRVEKNDKDMFIIHLSAYLKMYGEAFLKNAFKSIISKSVNGHVIIVSYQCRNYLKFSDSRFLERGQILIAEDDFDNSPSICFISPDLVDAFPNSFSGFESIGKAFENVDDKNIYIATDVDNHMFGMSVINISKLNDGYDILCTKEPRIKNVPESFGEAEDWNLLLKSMGGQTFSNVLEYNFGQDGDLGDCIRFYPSYSRAKQWLLFLSYNINGTRKGTYLSLVVNSVSNYKDIPQALFRTILLVDHNDEDFGRLYNERKKILEAYNTYLSEIVDYCKVVTSKEKDYIYYLTDSSQQEKEKMIEWLDKYGCNYSSDELISILNIVFPDLAFYLTSFRFKNDLLDMYFDKYKYQKIVNKVFPDFVEIVEKQAVEHGFVNALKPRTAIVDKVDLTGAHAYFFDALGVEYLGYIQSKCNDYGLSTSISVGRCELPSLTCFNKDFVDVCNNKGCPVSDIKDLDEIKHHGEDNCDYEKTKLPVYLTQELEIIDTLLKRIQAELLNDKFSKAVIFSDHGASRLAVLHETENVWEMESKGVHSGRCCPKNEINTKPDFAIEESDYWVLANYDRFKGSRKANVEVHGGATLEEVAVPIIEISRKLDKVEVFILDDCKVITLSAKEIPVLKVYVGIISNTIALKINGKYYDAQSTDNKYIYELRLDDCTKKGIYSADVYNGSELLSEGNKFEIAKKGMSEVNLFD